MRNTAKFSVFPFLLRKPLTFLLVIFFSLGFVFAQQPQTPLSDNLKEITTPDSKSGWLTIDEQIDIKGPTFFRSTQGMFDLSQNDHMPLFRQTKSMSGYDNYHFQQHHKGLEVEGAEYIVHEMNGRVTHANGKLVIGLSLDVRPGLTEQEALKFALDHFPAKQYYWENAKMEKQIKVYANDPNATTFPKGNLTLAMRSFSQVSYDPRYFKLYWKFKIYASQPEEARHIYVDAQTGNIDHDLPLELKCSTGSGTTSFYGAKTFRTRQRGFAFGNDFILENDCHSADGNVHTRTFVGSNNFTDTNNNWNDSTAVTAHWCANQAYDYFNSTFGRRSWDDGGANLNVYTDASWTTSTGGTTGANSSWFKSPFGHKLKIGFGTSTATSLDDFSTLDIVGHEFTHGVVESSVSGGLVYEGESGALNESFADIFGTLVEDFADPTNFDWLIGEDKSGGASRSMSNPSSFSLPDTYQGTDWANTASTAADFGGVHTNSSVQNFWFFLLANGGSGINDNGDSFTVSSIGLTQACLIAYETLTGGYLTKNATFDDAREASIRAAISLYGSCSNQVIQVGAAWYAVGVGTTLSKYDRTLCGSIYPFTGDATYKGINTITSGGTGCATTVSAILFDVNFQAGNFIELKPGFSAAGASGSAFEASISPCAMSTYRFAGGSNSHSPYPNTEIPKISESFSELSMDIFPNPMSGEVSIQYRLPEAGEVTLSLFNLQGQEMKPLKSSEFCFEGTHHLTWNSQTLPAGIYYCRLQFEEKILTQKVVKR